MPPPSPAQAARRKVGIADGHRQRGMPENLFQSLRFPPRLTNARALELDKGYAAAHAGA